MARDYKSKRRPAGGFSGWLGVVCGLCLGLAVAGVIYLKDRHSDTPVVQANKGSKKRSRGSEPPDTAPDNRNTCHAPIFQQPRSPLNRV